uniref:Tryptophan--tRNA ligase, mitochondrial n=1 Tax=Phallusia mammillata TaxID=59560 RepID=A0A6F9DW37_9ASCI|nr:tryptophan--tRNA ligase, mitochondrial-like [Phallusia mammillata]
MAGRKLRSVLLQFSGCRFYAANVSRMFSSKSNYPTPKEEVIFSGIQPTGIPHIGNYLGAIKHWVAMQEKPATIYYSIVDMHSVTIPKDKSVLQNHILDMTACLLACGIDPKRSVLFQQSDVLEHSALSWLLGCQVPLNQLRKLPQWKEKTENLKHGGYLGVFSYPVLQTADILLYKTTHVPAGEDQAVHLELTNMVASLFNNFYGVFFPKVSLFSDRASARIRNLRDPTVKMSKSKGGKHTRIELTDTDDQIVNSVKKALTDFTSEVTYDPVNRPGVANLIEIHSGFTGLSTDEICQNSKQLDTGEYKLVVADAVIGAIRPIRDEYLRLRSDEGHLKDILRLGHEKAQETASRNWNEIRQLVGMTL